MTMNTPTPPALDAATVEACLAIVAEQKAVFASNDYATPQPIGGIMERFACDQIADGLKAPPTAQPAAEPVANVEAETYLSLRFVRADFTSHGGFQWPREIGATVTAPDWRDEAECGHGLHGWLWGEGDVGCWQRRDDDIMLVVRHGAFVELSGKIKFPTCTVEFIGDTRTATQFIAANGAAGKAINYMITEAGDGSTVTNGYRSTVTSGDGSTVTSGDRSTVTSGYGSTVTSGYRSTVTSGDGSTVTSGDGSTVTSGDGSTVTSGDGSTVTSGDGSTVTSGYGSTVTSGDRSTVTSGDRSTVTSGYRSTVTSGYGSTVTSGYRSTVTSGYGSTVTSGYRSTVTSGDRSTVTSGDGGVFYIRWWDGKRYRAAEGVVGENSIEANVAYRVVDGKLTAVTA